MITRCLHLWNSHVHGQVCVEIVSADFWFMIVFKNALFALRVACAARCLRCALPALRVACAARCLRCALPALRVACAARCLRYMLLCYTLVRCALLHCALLCHMLLWCVSWCDVCVTTILYTLCIVTILQINLYQNLCKFFIVYTKFW